MVEAKERTAEGGQGETFYSPRRVASWVLRWRELIELAQPTAGAICYDARLSQQTPGRKPSNPARYLEIMADLERAWASLRIWSIEWNVVKTLMDGFPLREFEARYRLSHGTAKEAQERACQMMAEKLGWRG